MVVTSILLPMQQAARAYILALADHHAVQRVVKSKSMISEEIDLNHALEAQGIETVETDLGEYIIQQAGEVPSHIIIPALHKTVEQVADIISTVASHDLPADPPQLTATARAILRDRFLAADMGISGVNFAIAESGTLAIVSNEGNVDMCTTLPRIHVALMGMERLVPTWDELPALLRILPMAATGQKITTYVSLLSGPRRPGEPDGPDETHLIILDNGRASILGTEFADVLRCIRCGACLNVCPIYRNIGGHAYGAVYPGPIGAVLSPLLVGDAASDLPYASSLCGACTEVCPVEIPLHDLLIKHRQRYVAEGKSPPAERLAFALLAQAWSQPGTFRWGNRIGVQILHIMGALMGSQGWLGRLPGPGADWTAERDFPVPRGEPFHKRWPRLAKQGNAHADAPVVKLPMAIDSSSLAVKQAVSSPPEGSLPPEVGSAVPLEGPSSTETGDDNGRAAFLTRVRQHLAQGRLIHRSDHTSSGIGVGEPPPMPGPVLPYELARRFTEEITLVAGSAEIVSTLQAAASVVVQLLVNAGAASVVLGANLPLDSKDLSVILSTQGIEPLVLPSHHSTRDDAPGEGQPLSGEIRAADMQQWRGANARATAGVTGASYAIADTGTVVLMAGTGVGRLPSLLPPIHVVVLPLSRLLPDLAAVCRIMGEQGRASLLPAGVVLATGPSRSSDIGGALVRGVHGPGRVHVIFVDDILEAH